MPTRKQRGEFTALVNEGWFNRYLEYTSVGEAPPQFHFGAILAVCAGGMKRRPLIGWEARRTYPNIYSLLIGPTGARKGSAIEKAQEFAKAANADILPTEGTHQGYYEFLRRRQDKTGEDATGLIISDEFSVLVSKDTFKKDMAKWLTDWYDSPDQRTRALRGREGMDDDEEYVVNNFCVSLLGASNMPWLRTLPTDAITGGFVPRFLIFDVADDWKRWVASPKYNNALALELKAELRLRIKDIPSDMPLSPMAEHYMKEWYEKDIRAQYEGTQDEQVRAWLLRKLPAALKMATVWQLVDGGPKDAICVEWLAKARAISDWMDFTIHEVYSSMGVTPEGAVADDVLRFVMRHNGAVSEWKIIRALRNKYRSESIRAALRTLSISRAVTQEVTPEDGSVWRLAG